MSLGFLAGSWRPQLPARRSSRLAGEAGEGGALALRPAELAAVDGGGGWPPAAWIAAESALSRPASAEPMARRRLRIPDGAFLPAPAAPSRPALAGSPAVANDNVGASETGRVAKGLRDALFLLLLAATIVTAFYGGREHGRQSVIVVPGPIGFGSEVT